MGKVVAMYFIIGALIMFARQIYVFIGLSKGKFHVRIQNVFNSPKMFWLRLLDMAGDVLIWPITICITIYMITHVNAQYEVLNGLEIITDNDKEDADE